MLKLIQKCFPPIVPILYVDHQINQFNSLRLLKKLNQPQFFSAKGFAIIVSIQNSMPVQVDKIVERIKQIKQQFKIPVYGFCLDKCSPQSFYMTSIADEVYALESTIFQLKGNQRQFEFDKFFQSYGIKKIKLKSNANTNSTYFDRYSSPNFAHLMNTKKTNLSQRLFKYSMQNRFLHKKNASQLQQKIKKYDRLQNNFMGQHALQEGLIDNLGSYYKVLSAKHPDCRFKIIKLLEEPIQVKKSMALLTSPFLLFLFMFKVVLKYSIIMYLYFKANMNQQKPNKMLSTS